MVKASTAPLVALAGALILASVAVSELAPASLLPLPERPFEGYGNPDVRVESVEYPRHATGADEVRVQIDRPPRRIVSQYSSTDEFAYAVIPPDRIVGVSQNAYQRRVSNVYAFAERYQPVIAADPERVLRAAPDLVLAPQSARSDLPALLRASGLPVYRMYTMFSTLASIEDHIRLVGYLSGEDALAAIKLRRFQEAIGRAASLKPSDSAPPRVMGFGGSYSYGSETLFTDILRVLGAENVAATHGLVGYDRVTDERIVQWNPDWIIAGADRGTTEQAHARLMASPAIASTNAARKGQVIVLEHQVFLPLSPFTARLVESIAEALYGNRRS